MDKEHGLMNGNTGLFGWGAPMSSLAPDSCSRRDMLAASSFLAFGAVGAATLPRRWRISHAWTAMSAQFQRFDFGSGSLPRGVFAWRSGEASVWDDTRSLRIAAPAMPRFNRDPASGAFLGLLQEESGDNLLVQAGALPVTRWATSAIHRSQEQAGDGPGGRKTILATTANDGTVSCPALALARGSFTFSVWARRRQGYGPVEITLDEGAGWREMSAELLGGRWARLALSDSDVIPRPGIRLAEKGDAIEIALPQLERGQFPSSEILAQDGHRDADHLVFTLGADAYWDFTWPVAARLGGERHIRVVETNHDGHGTFVIRIVGAYGTYTQMWSSRG